MSITVGSHSQHPQDTQSAPHRTMQLAAVFAVLVVTVACAYFIALYLLAH